MDAIKAGLRSRNLRAFSVSVMSLSPLLMITICHMQLHVATLKRTEKQNNLQRSATRGCAYKAGLQHVQHELNVADVAGYPHRLIDQSLSGGLCNICSFLPVGKWQGGGRALQHVQHELNVARVGCKCL